MTRSEEKEKPNRTPLGAYITRKQHEQLAALAERNERSMSAEVRLALRERIEADLQQKPKP